MAKKKTNKHNKASILENDPRANMYQGKDRELTNDDEETEVTEDTDVKAKAEATPEVEGFMDANNASAVPNKEEIPTKKGKGMIIRKDMMILKRTTIRNCPNGSRKRKLWKTFMNPSFCSKDSSRGLLVVGWRRSRHTNIFKFQLRNQIPRCNFFKN